MHNLTTLPKNTTLMQISKDHTPNRKVIQVSQQYCALTNFFEVLPATKRIPDRTMKWKLIIENTSEVKHKHVVFLLFGNGVWLIKETQNKLDLTC